MTIFSDFFCVGVTACWTGVGSDTLFCTCGFFCYFACVWMACCSDNCCGFISAGASEIWCTGRCAGGFIPLIFNGSVTDCTVLCSYCCFSENICIVFIPAVCNKVLCVIIRLIVRMCGSRSCWTILNWLCAENCSVVVFKYNIIWVYAPLSCKCYGCSVCWSKLCK